MKEKEKKQIAMALSKKIQKQIGDETGQLKLMSAIFHQAVKDAFRSGKMTSSELIDKSKALNWLRGDLEPVSETGLSPDW